MDRDLALLLNEITSALEGLSVREAQAVPHGTPGKWSIQNIMEHLRLTYLSTVETLESRLQKGRPTLSRHTPAQRIWKVVILRFGYFPHGRKAPAAVTPSLLTSVRSGSEMCQQTRTFLAQIDDLTRQGEETFGNKPAVSHSALGPLTMAEWRRFHLIHGRHHVKQIQAIRQGLQL